MDMRRRVFAVSLTFVIASAATALPTCPEWMSGTQCNVYMAPFHAPASAQRVRPLDNSGGEGCVDDGSLNMCTRSVSRSQANYHWCPGATRAFRCDLRWCEWNSCFDTNCSQSTTVYCCANPDDPNQRPDWSTTEVSACAY